MLVLRLAAYLLWIPGLFAVIAAVILPVVSHGLSRRGRVAAAWPQIGCGQVRAGGAGGVGDVGGGLGGAPAQPVHVHGESAPGPAGPLRGRLSGSECVWYRMRVLRRFLVKQIRYTSDEWQEVDVLVEEQIWGWDSGPFAVRDSTGSVLVAPALLKHTLNALGHPAELQLVDEIRDEGADPWHYQSGKLGVLLADGVLPPGLLESFTGPGSRTSGYRVQEDILRPGKQFYVFAVPGELGGEPIMAAPFQDVWAISADPMPVSLARGGRRTRSWALRFGLAGLALFTVSALLLMQAGRPPG
ncbi:MAG TPA: hypothetical protein VLW44_11970 [Streptosporangiaceae bacterium]|nr:hypothetical protein [Streptosporangiaceae bacterium]